MSPVCGIGYYSLNFLLLMSLGLTYLTRSLNSTPFQNATLMLNCRSERCSETRDSPDCHKSIPFDPSKSYILALRFFLAVSTVLAVLAVFSILAVLAVMTVLALTLLPIKIKTQWCENQNPI